MNPGPRPEVAKRHAIIRISVDTDGGNYTALARCACGARRQAGAHGAYPGRAGAILLVTQRFDCGSGPLAALRSPRPLTAVDPSSLEAAARELDRKSAELRERSAALLTQAAEYEAGSERLRQARWSRAETIRHSGQGRKLDRRPPPQVGGGPAFARIIRGRRPVSDLILRDVGTAITEQYAADDRVLLLAEEGIPPEHMPLAQDISSDDVHAVLAAVWRWGSPGRRAVRRLLGRWLDNLLLTGPDAELRGRLLEQLARQGWRLRPEDSMLVNAEPVRGIPVSAPFLRTAGYILWSRPRHAISS